MSNKNNGLAGEDEVQDQMLDTMATHAKAKDDDANNKDKPEGDYKSEISDLIDEMSDDDFDQEELEEDEQELLEAMNEYTKNHMKEEEYVVRGALLQCDCGSHHRMLNLPTCHGVYILKSPAMNSADNLGGLGDEGVDKDEINIPSFGICKSPQSGDIGEGTKDLEKEAPRDEDGKTIGEAGGAITGDRCKPNFLYPWQNSHKKTRVGVERDFAITTNSFLVCSYGGIVRVVTSGQEYETTEADIKDDEESDEVTKLKKGIENF